MTGASTPGARPSGAPGGGTHHAGTPHDSRDLWPRDFGRDGVSGLVTVDRATLYTRPQTPPALIGAAVSDETVAWCAEWADGLITVGIEPEDVRRKVRIYREAGGRGPFALQLHLSYAPDRDTALAIAHDQWRSNVFGAPACWDLDQVSGFDAVSQHVRPEDLHASVRISADLAQHSAWLNEYVEAGCDALYLHHVGKEQRGFLDAFGEHVLPQLDPGPPAPSRSLHDVAAR